MFSILHGLPDGNWTDSIVGLRCNVWPTVVAADQAIAELNASGVPGPWAIVQTFTLPYRDLH